MAKNRKFAASNYRNLSPGALLRCRSFLSLIIILMVAVGGLGTGSESFYPPYPVVADNTTATDPTIYVPPGTNWTTDNTTSENITIQGAQRIPQARLSVASIAANPTQVSPGQTVTISAVVTNSGNASGNYMVTLKINEMVDQSKQASLAAGESQVVSFPVSRNNAGNYNVDVNGKTIAFTVSLPQVASTTTAPRSTITPAKISITEITVIPDRAPIGEKVIVQAVAVNRGGSKGSYNAVMEIIGNPEQTQTSSASIAPGSSQEISFEMTQNSPGTYVIDLNGQQAVVTFTQRGIFENRMLWLATGAGLILFVLLVLLITIIRRRSQYV